MAKADKAAHPLRKGLRVLEILADSPRPLGVTEIAKTAELAKSTVHDILRALREFGYVESRDARFGYEISPRIMTMFHDMERHFTRGPEVDELLHVTCRRLRCSIYLSRLVGGRVVVVGGYFREVSAASLGSSLQVYKSSAGKALVAKLPLEEWEIFMPKDQALAEKLRKELELAGEEGVGWNRGEFYPAVCSVAAPVPRLTGTPHLAAALVMPRAEFLARDRQDLVDQVKALAEAIADHCPNL